MRRDRQPRSSAESLYASHYRLLWSVAARKFGVPAADVEELIHDVMVSFLANETTVREPEKWLVAAICNASRHYWRRHSRDEVFCELSDAAFDTPAAAEAPDDRIALELTAAMVLDQVSPRCRETLRLHYFEGLTAPELASAFSTTRRYAEYLIHKCLRRALRVFDRLEERFQS